MRNWVILAVLLVPVASAAPVDLYAHVNGFSDFPMNTQEPEPESYDRQEFALATQSGCVEDPVGAQHFTEGQYHTWYGFSSPAAVEYGTDNGRPVVHHERGIMHDVLLDPAETPTVHWFLQLPAATEGVPVAPDVFVRATLRQGDDVSVGDAAFNTGAIIAAGQSDAVTLSAEVDHPQVTHHRVDGRDVYEFSFPLELERDTIDAEEAFNLRIDAIMENPVCEEPDGYLNPSAMQPHQSPGLYSRLQLHVLNPIMIDGLHPQATPDGILLHIEASSPFGTYDVADKEWLFFPKETPAVELVESDAANGSTQHNWSPQLRSYFWDTSATEPGIYPFEIRVENLQETANATLSGEMRLDPGADICFEDGCLPLDSRAEAPGLPLAALLGALLAALIVFARR